MKLLRVYIKVVFKLLAICCVLAFAAELWGSDDTNGASALNGNSVPAHATNSVESVDHGKLRPDPAAGPVDYAAFKIINERNIFNSKRSARTRRSDAPRTVKVESFTLVGTMSYSVEDVAFFESASSRYRKAAKAGESIAGYKVISVLPNSVELEKEGRVLEMAIGAQMKREEEGPWELTGSRLGLAGREKSDESADSSSGDGDDEVLKRLLQKRETEESK
jgi:hypothetical protein